MTTNIFETVNNYYLFIYSKNIKNNKFYNRKSFNTNIKKY